MKREGGQKEESGGRGQKKGERNLQQSLSSFLTSFFKVYDAVNAYCLLGALLCGTFSI